MSNDLHVIKDLHAHFVNKRGNADIHFTRRLLFARLSFDVARFYVCDVVLGYGYVNNIFLDRCCGCYCCYLTLTLYRVYASHSC